MTLINSNLLKKVIQHFKIDVDKSDIDELKKVPSNLKRLKDKIDKLDDDKMKTVPVDLKILNDAVY